MTVTIAPYNVNNRSAILSLSMRAWKPVFDQLEPTVAPYVYSAFYPNGWQARQNQDIENFLDSEPENIWIAAENGDLAGWVGIRLHPEDSMGELYILAVKPEAQRKGIAQLLIETACHQLRKAGMKIIMVETGDDPGHAPSRAAYEKAGFERWPVARYFREL